MTNESILNDFSYEVNSPTALLLNKRIDDRGYRLYGIIKGLTRAHGYCYATNTYLAKTLNTSEATIKRTLKSLREEGVIEIQTDKNGIHWQRRIFVGTGIKKCLRRITAELPPAHGCTPPSSPVSHNISIVNRNIVDKETPPTPKGELVEFGKFVKLTKEESEALSIHCGGTEILNGLIEEINDYLASTGKKPYKDYAATIRNWMRRRKVSNAPRIDQNREVPALIRNKDWWTNLGPILKPHNLEQHICTGPDYVEFSFRGNLPERIYFREDNFMNIAKNYLKKLEIFV